MNSTGNHDMTLDPPFYEGVAKHKFKWSGPQDTAACRQLLMESKTITYLEHSSATIYLTSPSGPRTCFKVFGSPYSPGQRGWAFQYPLSHDGQRNDEAERLWEKIEEDTDIVITHTPAKGHADTATKDDRAGCGVLERRLGVVRPMMSVFGHIHEGRGVERVKWKDFTVSTPPNDDTGTVDSDSLVKSVEYWTDPGAGNKKVSLVDLTGKTGRRLDNTGGLTRQFVPVSLKGLFGGQPDADKANSPSSLEDVALPTQHQGSEAGMWRKDGGAVKWRGRSDVGPEDVAGRRLAKDAVAEDVGLNCEKTGVHGGRRRETVMVNAAFLGPRIVGKAMEFNKPIVVDIELPVWEFEN